MLVKVVAVLAAIPAMILAGLVALVAATGLALVDVREGGPHGHRIVVPVPLVLADLALRAAPLPARRVKVGDLGDAERLFPVAEEMLAALGEAPDGELVRVEEPDQQVVVEKAGGQLRVRVRGRRSESVDVQVPLAIAQKAVHGLRTGDLDVADLVRELRQARLSRLVEVRDGDNHVRVSIW
jgi:hypothetical protein